MTSVREWRAGTAPGSRAETSEETRGRWVLGGSVRVGLAHPSGHTRLPTRDWATGPHDQTKDRLQRECRGRAVSGIGRSEMVGFTGPRANRRVRPGPVASRRVAVPRPPTP